MPLLLGRPNALTVPREHTLSAQEQLFVYPAPLAAVQKVPSKVWAQVSVHVFSALVGNIPQARGARRALPALILASIHSLVLRDALPAPRENIPQLTRDVFPAPRENILLQQLHHARHVMPANTLLALLLNAQVVQQVPTRPARLHLHALRVPSVHFLQLLPQLWLARVAIALLASINHQLHPPRASNVR